MNLVTILALFWDTLSEVPGGHEKGLRGLSGSRGQGDVKGLQEERKRQKEEAKRKREGGQVGARARYKRRSEGEKEKNPNEDGNHDDADVKIPDFPDFSEGCIPHDGGHGGGSPSLMAIALFGQGTYGRSQHRGRGQSGEYATTPIPPSAGPSGEQGKGEKDKKRKRPDESGGGGQGDDDGSSQGKPGDPCANVRSRQVVPDGRVNENRMKAISRFVEQRDTSVTIGDCFYQCLVDACSEGGVSSPISVPYLRELVSENLTEEDFLDYELMEENSAEEFSFMRDVDSLEDLKAKFLTSEVWADQKSIERLQLMLKIKVVILDESYELVEEKIPNRLREFTPDYIVVVRFTDGNHYQLMGTKSGKTIFTLGEAFVYGVFDLTSDHSGFRKGFFSIIPWIQNHLAQGSFIGSSVGDGGRMSFPASSAGTDDSRSEHTIFLSDWDDTLINTQESNRIFNGIKDAAEDDQKHIRQEILMDRKRVEHSGQALLEEMLRIGTPYIITLGNVRWFEQSSSWTSENPYYNYDRFFIHRSSPDWVQWYSVWNAFTEIFNRRQKPLLEDIKKELESGHRLDSKVKAKQIKFDEIINKIELTDNEQTLNVIIMGDGADEIEAGKNIRRKIKEKESENRESSKKKFKTGKVKIKTVKLKENPTFEELEKQHKFLKENLASIIDEPKELDYKLKIEGGEVIMT